MILYVPNTAIQYEGGRHYLPRPDFDFLASLSDEGKQITVIGFVSERTDPFSDSSLEDISGVSIFNLGKHVRFSGKLRKLGFYMSAIVRCLGLLSRQRGFVYLYFPGHMAKLIGLYCSLTGRPFALYVRGIWGQAGIAGWVARRLFRHAAFVFTTGLGFRNIVQAYNSSVEPVFPMTTFIPETQPAAERDGRSVHELLFVGHARERKGVLDCIRAVGKLRDDGRDMRLHIIGGGDQVDIDAINRVVDETGLDQDSVIYHGHVSEREKLAEFFSQADVFLYPSYYPEGFPRVVYEAMIFGLPIVCTILPGMKGFIEDGVNCLQVEDRSPGQIYAAIAHLDDEPDMANRLGTAARQMVSDYFDEFSIKGHVNQFRHRLARLEQDGYA